MANSKKKYNYGNTNAEELLTIWKNDEHQYGVVRKYVSASLDFWGSMIEDIRALANIPDITFYYDDKLIFTIQKIADTKSYLHYKCRYGCWENIYLIGKDGKTEYTLVISFETVKKGCFGKCYIYPHRVDENGNVEIFDTANKTWVNVNPKIMTMIRCERGNWARGNLVEAFQDLTDIFHTYTVDEVREILTNDMLLALYRILKHFLDFRIEVNDQWHWSAKVYLVPKDPLRKCLAIRQSDDNLVLGCVANLGDEEPRFVEVYKTEHVDNMAKLLKIFCREGSYKIEHESNSEWSSGLILAPVWRNHTYVLDNVGDQNRDDIPPAYYSQKEEEGDKWEDYRHYTEKQLATLGAAGNALPDFVDVGYRIFIPPNAIDIALEEGMQDAIPYLQMVLYLIQIGEQLILCFDLSELDSNIHDFRLFIIYDTDSINEMAEALKIIYKGE